MPGKSGTRDRMSWPVRTRYCVAMSTDEAVWVAERTASGPTGRRLRVGRLIEVYDLEHVGAELERLSAPDGRGRDRR